MVLLNAQQHGVRVVVDGLVCEVSYDVRMQAGKAGGRRTQQVGPGWQMISSLSNLNTHQMHGHRWRCSLDQLKTLLAVSDVPFQIHKQLRPRTH